MGVTLIDYQNYGNITYVDDNPFPFDANNIYVDSISNNEIDLSFVIYGLPYKAILKGNFSIPSNISKPSFLNEILDIGGKLTRGTILFNNSTILDVYSSNGISIKDWYYLNSQNNLTLYQKFLSGDDVFITANTQRDDIYYLYDGNDIFYENHLSSGTTEDYYGGNGIDTAVFPGKLSDFTIKYSQTIWDSITKKGNLEGFIISDNNKKIESLQINQVEKLQFSDQTFDLIPYLSTTQKGVTVQFNGSQTINTAYYPSSTNAPPENLINITKFTNTEIDFSTTFEGKSYTGIFYGIFDTTAFTKSPQTFNDITNKGLSLLVQKFILNTSNENIRTETYNKAVAFDDFWAWEQGKNSSVYLNFLSGDDTFITSNNGDDTNSLPAYGYAGNDTFFEKQKLLKYKDIFYGGTEIDTVVYSGKSTNFSIISSSNVWDDVTQKSNLNGFVITDNTKGVNTLQINQVEKIQFGDLTLDTTSFTKTAALSHTNIINLVELYIASFNRAPDSVGLDYWGGRFSDGMSLQDIAKSFFVQPETVAAYPSNMPTSDFVTKVYNNVLSRGPDTGGLNYWVGQLNNGSVSKDSFLLAIINGAMAPTGSAVDRQTLANKEAVGEHYAIYQGLNNSTYWAKDVMSGVTDQMSTVVTANTKSDAYAALAANPATSDLVVKLVGVAV
jgi:hypothetical protein